MDPDDNPPSAWGHRRRGGPHPRNTAAGDGRATAVVCVAGPALNGWPKGKSPSSTAGRHRYPSDQCRCGTAPPSLSSRGTSVGGQWSMGIVLWGVAFMRPSWGTCHDYRVTRGGRRGARCGAWDHQRRPVRVDVRPGLCLKGRALWGQTQRSYKAVGARCEIGWGAVTGGWKRGWGGYWGCGRASG